MAAVPSIGRAVRVEGAPAPEADLTRALYEQYANQIFRYCLHQLGSREEAEDAVQSTFLNAFRGIKRGVVPELESAWLFKIAHNVCLSRRRTTWRRGRIESPADFDVVEELTPAPSRRADELIGLQDVLEQMPENQRRAILLREWQGLSYREIGEELELSQAAVETLIFRARRSLAAGLEQPPEGKKRLLVRGADLGNLLAGIKSVLLGGATAAKVAATVAVVSAGTVVAAAPVQQHRSHSHHPAVQTPAPASTSTQSTAGSTSSVAGPATSVPASRAGHGAKAHGHAAARHFGSLGFATPDTSSLPDDGTVGAPPAEPAPVDVGPAPAAPAEAPAPPPAQETPAPQPAADPPHQATPAPASTPATNDKSKGDGDSKGSDSKGKDAKTSSAGAVTPTVTLAVRTNAITQAVTNVVPSVATPDTTTPAVTTSGYSTNGDDSKGNGDAKKSDSDKKSSATPTPTQTQAPTTTTPAPAAAPPATTAPAAPVATLTTVVNNIIASIQAVGGKSKDRAKDSGNER